MTIEQAWQIITDCTLREDWVGVLVGADALSECGCEEEAAGVRWMIRQENKPDFNPYARKASHNWQIDFKYNFGSGMYYAPTCRMIWDVMLKLRRDAMEYYL